MRIKSFWNADKIVSISAMVVSVGSLFIIVYQTSLIRREQHASVMPYLELAESTKHPKHLAFKLSNTGLGPAMIKEVRVQYSDEIYEGGYKSFYLQHFSPAGWYTANPIRPGQLIPANTEITLLETGDEASYERIAKLDSAFYSGDAVLEIIYASIYGQTWILRSNELIPQELD